MKWMIPLLLVLALAGCQDGENVINLENETSLAINNDAIANHSNFAVKSVSLVLEYGNKYTGYAEMIDGSRHPITVTYDGNKLIYQFTG